MKKFFIYHILIIAAFFAVFFYGLSMKSTQGFVVIGFGAAIALVLMILNKVKNSPFKDLMKK